LLVTAKQLVGKSAFYTSQVIR